MRLKRQILGWDTFSEKERESIIKNFTFKDPKAFFNEAVRRGWSSGTACLMDKKTGLIPFGLEEYLNGEYEVGKIKIDLILNLIYSKHLYDYQMASLDAFFKVNFGIIKVSTGGGKTVIAQEAIRMSVANFGSNYRCLFIVDQKDLLEQTKNRFENELGYKVGVYNSKKLRDYKDYPVVVTTIQTLQAVLEREVKKVKTYRGRKVKMSNEEWEKKLLAFNKEKEFLTGLLASVKFLVIDEIQSFGSEERTKLIHKYFTNLNSLMGLSATPFRKEDPIAKRRIIGYSGGIVYTIKEQELVDKGRLAERRILMIYHKEDDVEKFIKNVPIKLVERKIKEENKQYDDDGKEIKQYTEIPDYGKLYENFIIRNEKRNEIVSLVIEALKRFGRNSLCLFTRKEHGNSISEKTGFPFVDGGSEMSERKEKIDLLQNGSLNVLLASNIFNKGVDIPAINVLFNIGAGKGEEITTQKKGRVLRTVKDNPMYNKALIIDFYDDFPKIFVDHSDIRLKSYEREIEGEDNIVFIEFDGNVDKFLKYLKEEFIIWFGK